MVLARDIMEKAIDAKTIKTKAGLLGDAEMRVLPADKLRGVLRNLFAKNGMAWDRLLQDTGVSRDKILDFVDTVARLASSPGADPATFLVRGVILTRSLSPGKIAGRFAAGGAALGGAGSGGIAFVSIGAFMLSINMMARLISTSGGLKLLREGLQVGAAPKAQVLARLATRMQRMLAGKDVDEVSQKSTLVQVFDSGQEAVDFVWNATALISKQGGDLYSRVTGTAKRALGF